MRARHNWNDAVPRVRLRVPRDPHPNWAVGAGIGVIMAIGVGIWIAAIVGIISWLR